MNYGTQNAMKQTFTMNRHKPWTVEKKSSTQNNFLIRGYDPYFHHTMYMKSLYNVQKTPTNSIKSSLDSISVSRKKAYCNFTGMKQPSSFSETLLGNISKKKTKNVKFKVSSDCSCTAYTDTNKEREYNKQKLQNDRLKEPLDLHENDRYHVLPIPPKRTTSKKNSNYNIHITNNMSQDTLETKSSFSSLNKSDHRINLQSKSSEISSVKDISDQESGFCLLCRNCKCRSRDTASETSISGKCDSFESHENFRQQLNKVARSQNTVQAEKQNVNKHDSKLELNAKIKNSTLVPSGDSSFENIRLSSKSNHNCPDRNEVNMTNTFRRRDSTCDSPCETYNQYKFVQYSKQVQEPSIILENSENEDDWNENEDQNIYNNEISRFSLPKETKNAILNTLNLKKQSSTEFGEHCHQEDSKQNKIEISIKSNIETKCDDQPKRKDNGDGSDLDSDRRPTVVYISVVNCPSEETIQSEKCPQKYHCPYANVSEVLCSTQNSTDHNSCVSIPVNDRHSRRNTQDFDKYSNSCHRRSRSTDVINRNYDKLSHRRCRGHCYKCCENNRT